MFPHICVLCVLICFGSGQKRVASESEGESTTFGPNANETKLDGSNSCNCVHFVGIPSGLLEDYNFCTESHDMGRINYKSKDGKYLYFDETDQTWAVNSNPESGNTYVDAFVHDTATFPTEIKEAWLVNSHGMNVKNYKMKVKCGLWKTPIPTWGTVLIAVGLAGFILLPVAIVIRRRRRAMSSSIPYGNLV